MNDLGQNEMMPLSNGVPERSNSATLAGVANSHDFAPASTAIRPASTLLLPAKKPRKRGGAPRHNLNALKHGCDCRKPRLWRGVSKRRPDLHDVESECGRFYAQLASRVEELGRPIDINVAMILDTAVSWHFHAALAMRHLAAGQLDAATELALSREAAKAKASRDAEAARLNLDEKRDDLWADIPALPLTGDDDVPDAPPSDASGETDPTAGQAAPDACTGIVGDSVEGGRQ